MKWKKKCSFLCIFFTLMMTYIIQRNMRRKGLVSLIRNNFDSLKDQEISDYQLCVKKSNCLDIHIALAISGEEYLQQGTTLAKSILLFSKARIHFLIFSNNETAVNSFKQTLKTLNSELGKNSTASHFHIQWSYLSKRNYSLREINKILQYCTKTHMFLQLNYEILHIKKVLILDVDMVVLTDIAELWCELFNFEHNQILGMTPGGRRFLNADIKSPFVKPYGLNGGLYLINFTRARHVGYAEEIISIANNRSNHIHLRNEQTLANIYFSKNIYRLYNISCMWNFAYGNDPCFYKDISKGIYCEDAYRHGIKILHGTAHTLLRKEMYNIIYNAMKLYDMMHKKPGRYWNETLSAFSLKRKAFCKDNTIGLVQSLHQSVLKHTTIL